MNDIILRYLTDLKELKEIQHLADYSGTFLKSEMNFMQFMIIHHEPKPDPLSLVFLSDNSVNFTDWKNSFSKFKKTVIPFESIEAEGYHYCFMQTAYSHSSGDFIVSKNIIDTEILSLVRCWDTIKTQLLKAQINSKSELKSEYSGLNSQLMHDIQAIIDLTENSDTNTALKQRIEYQKKVNKNFLFWIRDIELMKSNVPVKDLIISSLQLLSIDPSHISLKISKHNPQLRVDVELFSKAFNEIISNALSAVQNDLSKIEIEISVSISSSPLLNTRWLKLQVRDTGEGIPEDFLPFIFNPFFTTEKNTGHTGFGLPIAKKVFEAHNGAMEIKSAQGMGTIVKIYLPI